MKKAEDGCAVLQLNNSDLVLVEAIQLLLSCQGAGPL